MGTVHEKGAVDASCACRVSVHSFCHVEREKALIRPVFLQRPHESRRGALRRTHEQRSQKRRSSSSISGTVTREDGRRKAGQNPTFCDTHVF